MARDSLGSNWNGLHTMGDFFSKEVFRPVATIFAPGIVAVTPYVVLLLLTYPDIQSFAHDNAGAAVVVAVVCAIAVGLLLEDIGARIEVCWDALLEKKTGDHKETWQRYLSLTLPKDPIGQSYLRTVLLRMKFELGLVAALPISWLGLLWLNEARDLWGKNPFWISTGIMALVFIWILVESYSSAKVLAEVRKLLVKRYKRVPDNPE